MIELNDGQLDRAMVIVHAMINMAEEYPRYDMAVDGMLLLVGSLAMPDESDPVVMIQAGQDILLAHSEAVQ